MRTLGVLLFVAAGLYAQQQPAPAPTTPHPPKPSLERIQKQAEAARKENRVDDAIALYKKGVAIKQVAKTFRPMTSLPFIANTGFDKQKGNRAIDEGDSDAIAYGTLFLANPYLVERFERDASFNKPDPATFYGRGPKGYTDYPTLSDRSANAT